MFYKDSQKKRTNEKKMIVKSREEIESIAKQVINDEKKAVENLCNYIDESFSKAVEILF